MPKRRFKSNHPEMNNKKSEISEKKMKDSDREKAILFQG